ncbi:Hpt domain-containing protein [Uliginosibacterium sp. H3]|uniref:histidine kinase n=1 Tax=Uliginosibacterium silvisoli TaxID=3114758 RepID=A0ABU6JXE5_9RHOO|nr:Hpt domain-containing protein [Uliginosibacterium sp. H3]
MSQVTDFDIGPLTWVKAEIDAALAKASDSLGEAQANPEQREPLRFAQSHVHQASGALSVVGLDGVSQFSEAIDKLLSSLAGAEDTPSGEALALARRSLAVLANYLSELLAGAAHKPLRLYPAYRELVAARGEEPPPASELFFPDLRARPSLPQGEQLDPQAAALELRLLRGRFEKGLLLWIRQPQSPSGAQEMLRAVQRIEQIQAQPSTRAFWWAAIAFFEGLAQQVIPVERATQRLCRRIDTQMRRLIEGSQVVADRLVRDVLYYVATANVATPHAQSVRSVYRLEAALPAPDQELSDTLRQPLVLKVRESLENTKDAWNRFCAGAAVALPLFQDHLAELVQRVAPMRVPQLDALLSGMTKVTEWLRADPLRQSDALSMELATGLLVIEQAAESPAYDQQLLRRQVELLNTIFEVRSKGGNPPEMDDALFGEASQRAQEKLLFNQLAREILTNLGQIEQTLDTFFRNPEQREPLAALTSPLKQIEGAFSMLGEMSAAALVRESAGQVAALAESADAPSQEACDDVAHKLSALGFYVEAIKTAPAKLEHFLNPESAFAPEEEQVAVSETVEAQLLRESRETRNLADALQESPQDSGLRDQLVHSLEAIREDAQLVADSALEKQTKDVIASLKAGEDVSSEQIQEALSNVAPAAAPQPSEEAARLMQASSEEVDAELLEIFLEEAHEVLGTLREHREIAAREPHNQDALTTLRRAFHTLKGSSRMVGLIDFSDAAKYIEATMNRWLQLEKDANAELISLIDNATNLFSAWVEQLQSGGGLWRDAAALTQQAQSILASLDASPEDLAAGGLSLVPAEPRPPISEEAVAEDPATASEGIDLDLNFDDLDPEPALEPIAEQPNTSAANAQGPGTPIDLTLDDQDLAELDLPTSTGTHQYETSLEETRMDMPMLGSLGVDEILLPDLDTPDDATQTSLGDEPLAELDLASTLMEGDLERFSSGETELSELDLTATLIEGLSPSDGEALLDRNFTDLTSTDLDLNLGEHPEAEFDLVATALGTDFSEPFITGDLQAAPQPEVAVDMLEPEEVFGESALAVPQDEPVIPTAAEEVEEVPAIAEPAPLPSPVNNEHLVEVAIEDDEGDIDLPVINLAALSSSEPAPGDMAPRVAALLGSEHASIAEPQYEETAAELADGNPLLDAEAAPGSTPDSEITVGNNVLSHGLYYLYLGESAQHLATLRGDQHLIDSNPLHVPSMEAVRAAHTLAGISGTARFESVHSLAKALEHAQNRLRESQIPPDPAQAALFDATLNRLEAMQTEIVRQQMPLPSPELSEQLNNLRPLLPSTPAEEPEPVEEIAPVLVEESFAPPPAAQHDELDLSGIHDELDEQLLPIFFEEADELMAEIGSTVRQMRSEPESPEPRNALARLMHTLKGSARMAGAMRVGQYVHVLEGRLEETGNQGPSPAFVDELENGFDQVGNLLEALRNPAPVVVPTPAEDDDYAAQETAQDSYVAPVAQQSAQTLDDAAPVSRFSAPADSPLIPAVLRQTAVTEEPEAAQSARALVRVRADMVDRFVNEAGEISIARTRVEGEMRTVRRSLLDLTENVIRLRNQLREVEIQAESQMQSRIAAAESQHDNFDPLEFDRFTRLQELTRMMAESVGDVTTVQQNLLRNLDGADAALHAQGRLSRDLQQALMGVRMVPFNEVSDRLYRVVRQTAKELGKRANLDIQGGAIEIDRGVLDKMIAPLEHLLRNAIAHGIEMPDERAAAGKPEIGQILLRLNQHSNEIALEMTDDGKGLNYERIAARGRKVGLIGEHEEVSEVRLTQLIFEPGFSTAETVSGIAGRGVGMDVVKNEAMAVGGRIDVSSTPGQGARFLIHLPLTLAVTQALLVRAGTRTYAIPSNMVEQAIEVKEGQLEEIRARGYAEWKDQQYPLRYLPRLLGDNETQPIQQRFHWILLLRAGNASVGLYIDALRGNQEIIVKNAGPQFVRLQGYSGATVLPDGEVSLILNPVVMAGRQATVVDDLAPTELVDTSIAADYVPTVMVVDDSLTVRKITTRLLEREGYKAVTAKDGVDALEQLTELIPDVMLLDIEMPRMDGFDLARNIRGDARLRDIPIIMITSRMADKHRNYAAEIGVNHYLGKPYQEDQLLELISAFVFAQRNKA